MSCDFLPAQGFFFITTLLFFLLSLLLMRQLKQVRKKLSDSIAKNDIQKKALAQSENPELSLLNNILPPQSSSIVISVNRAGEITSLNEHAESVFGYSKKELIGHSAFGTILPANNRSDSLQANLFSRIFANPKMYVEHETENITKEGKHLWISWTNRLIYDDAGKPVELQSVGFDISKRKHLEEELRFLASVDPLTGALNRQAFLEVGAKELKRANRYNRQISVVVFRLDYYAGVQNKTFQTFSDEVLQELVILCKSIARDSDYLGRISDTEFAFILPETPAENAVLFSQRLKQKIQEKNLQMETGSFITTAFGVAGKATKDDTIDALLLRAFDGLEEASKAHKAVKPKKGKGGLK